MKKTGGKFLSKFSGKKKLVKFVLIIAFLPVGIAIPLLSLESYNSSQTSAQSTINDQQLQDRIEKYKENLKEELTDERRQNIINKCDESQTKVAEFIIKIEKVKDNRKSRYMRVSEKLSGVVDKLDSDSIDPTELGNVVTDYELQSQQFNKNIDGFLTTLNDLIEINCSSDPLAYQAALSEARKEIADLKTQAVDIRSDLTKIKELLSAIRIRLGN
ncbi:MAG: hypothetical protein M3P98_03280 [bacterium]|nr:hypothetical protein [bacterium]